MEVSSNNMLDYQNLDQQSFVIDLPIRPGRNPILQEQVSNSTSQLSSANNTVSTVTSTNTNITTNTTNTLQQDEGRDHIKCYCGINAVLKEVKANTINKGRHFWSCSRFGGPSHLRRCNFFEWDSTSTKVEQDDNDVTAESSSSTAHNVPEMPYVLIEPVDINNHNINNSDDGDDDGESDEVNLSPRPDLISENEVTTSGSIARTRATSYRRIRDSNRSASSQSPPLNTTNETDNNADDPRTTNVTRDLTNDLYTRNPTVFGNWDDVPKYSVPQLLDIVQNHLVQQDKGFIKWYTATQLAKNDLDKAKKEVEKLKKDLEVINKENDLYKRENDVLKAEKRLLEIENSGLKEENQGLKRRRY